MKFAKCSADLCSVLACTVLLLAMSFLLAGCNGFWAPPTGGGGTTGGGTTATTLSSGNFYVINQATSQLAAYNINAGKLSQIGASPLAAAPIAIAMAPGGKFLYVSSVAGIFLYSIGANGALTVGNNGNVISSDPASALAVDPSGAWLIDAVQGSSGVQLDATPINSSGAYTGATVGSEQYALANASVHQIAVSGDERYVFVAAGQGGTLVVPFSAGSSNPLGTSARSTGPLAAGGSALSVAVDPGASPRLLYIGETLASGGNSGGLRVLNYSSLGTASFTEVANSPFASGGTAPNAILPVAGGDDVYVASGAGPSAAGSIAGFSIVDTSGVFSVTKVSTVSTGELPAGLAEDNQSHFVLAVSSAGNSDLECYFFDTATAGKLDDTINANTGTDPTEAVGIAAAP